MYQKELEGQSTESSKDYRPPPKCPRTTFKPGWEWLTLFTVTQSCKHCWDHPNISITPKTSPQAPLMSIHSSHPRHLATTDGCSDPADLPSVVRHRNRQEHKKKKKKNGWARLMTYGVVSQTSWLSNHSGTSHKWAPQLQHRLNPCLGTRDGPWAFSTSPWKETQTNWKEGFRNIRVHDQRTCLEQTRLVWILWTYVMSHMWSKLMTSYAQQALVLVLTHFWKKDWSFTIDSWQAQL